MRKMMSETKSKTSIMSHETSCCLKTEEPTLPEEWRSSRASGSIQAGLVLWAWRLQKQENNELKFNIKTLSDKVDSLQLQKTALGQLLSAEKVRLAIMNNDLHKILNNLDECRHEKSLLLKEKEQLQDRIKVMEENFSRMKDDYMNQKNDLLTAKLEARNWEKQLEKEREKLSKIKSDKKLSIEDAKDTASEESTKETTVAGGATPTRKPPGQRDAKIKGATYRNTKKNPPRSGRDVELD